MSAGRSPTQHPRDGGSLGPGSAEGGDAEIPAGATYRVALPEFEGPLDLLLHLCKTHELDILNIPISFVASKYLEYLETMQSLSVEIAAEYLVMAATLAYLKSRELVPSPDPLESVADENGEEALDPREELIRRLLEYQKYKDAAEKLLARPIEGRNVFLRGSLVESSEGPGPLADHSPWKLIEAFAGILKEAGSTATHDVVVDRLSITDRINQLVDQLEAGGGSFRFDSVIDLNLPEAELRHQVVVTLLAVLELAKLKAIRVLHDPASETFIITQVNRSALEEARHADVTSDQVAAAEPAASEGAVVGPEAAHLGQEEVPLETSKSEGEDGQSPVAVDELIEDAEASHGATQEIHHDD